MRAPGGKLVTTCVAHIKTARTQSIGVADMAAHLKSMNGLDLMQKSISIVETFIAETRRRCHRYWTKATAKAPLIANPKALARTFEAVET